jgi:peroxiredoxin
MPKIRSVAVLSLLAGGLLGAGVWVLGGGPAGPGGGTPTTASLSPPAVGRPVPPAAGRLTPAVEDAMRALDLIRPSRAVAADDFSGPLLDGTTFRLADHRGQVVFLNFWATWCPPCREEMPAMERLWRAQRATGLVMVAVSVDADPKVVAPFIAEHDLTFPIVLDPGMEIANLYQVRALPSSFIIDPDGMMAALALGPRQWDNRPSHALVEGLAGVR